MKRTTIQRIHATVLIILGVSLAIATTISTQTGTGIYPWLRENPMVHGGLIQAYLLMAVVGTAYRIGVSGNDAGWKWSLIGIIAHFPPLIALLMYWNLFTAVSPASLSYISLSIHVLWIALEVFVIIGVKWRQPAHE